MATCPVSSLQIQVLRRALSVLICSLLCTQAAAGLPSRVASYLAKFSDDTALSSLLQEGS